MSRVQKVVKVYVPRNPTPEQAREAARLLIEAAEEAERPKLPEMVEGKWYVVRSRGGVFPRRFMLSGHGVYECGTSYFQAAVLDGDTSVEPLIVDGVHL